MEASQAVFVGVNVNIEARQAADVSAATKAWRLDEVPTWYFLTGSPAELERAWRDYNIAVERSLQNDELLHTPGIYIIDPSGQKRWYISIPFSEKGNTEWILPLDDLLVRHIREILREDTR